MPVCKVCGNGKEYKNLPSHLRGAHGMSISEYHALYGSEKTDTVDEEFDEVEESDIEPEEETQESESEPEHDVKTDQEEDKGISYKERISNIFDNKEPLKEDGALLHDFLKRYDIELKELVSIVNQYKTGSAIPVSQQLLQKEKIGKIEAEKLSNKERVETHDLSIAESLVKNEGFEVIEVSKSKSNIPGKKVWILRKK